MVSLTTGTGLSESWSETYGLTTSANGNLDFFNRELVVGTTFKVDLKYSGEQFASGLPLTDVPGARIIGGGGNCKSAIGGGVSLSRSVE
ncbi:hypothetical protein OGATHE_005632 [Ogataea polymorpha]|uniref:Uncharacterized protein n=1 Tax=Ogataea polymorpha TaxID=460523 RepID=A0A9P8NUG3_9ASCO|nr:hypothetical protein OGATHE_005632 [Ogataea polymorpha]